MKKKVLAAVIAAMCFGNAIPASIPMTVSIAAENAAEASLTDFGTGGLWSNPEGNDIILKNMTPEDVIELAKKRKKITWTDFDGFNVTWRKTTLYSRFCKVDLGSDFFLIVGGEPDYLPEVVWLCYSSTENFVDLKTGDVEEFLKEYNYVPAATTVTTAATTTAVTTTTTAAATTTTAVTTRTTEIPELYKFTVIVLSVSDTTLLVKPDKEYEALKGYDEFVMGINQLNNDIKPTVGMKLEISCLGVGFIDTNPAHIGTVENVTVVSDAPAGTKEMTLDDVVELSKKGDSLGWSDFEPYKAHDASTCIQCWEYDLGNGFHLKVGGPPDSKPDFILLGYYSFNDCDVRTEDVSAFIDFITAKYIIIKGDANFDRYVDMSDVVLVMQALANPNKYGLDGTDEKHLTEQGMKNADMDGNGLTVGDAQAIQRKLLHISDIDRSVIAGKTFVYEKEGFGSDFEITFNEDGTYIYSPGVLSSYLGSGTWEIEDEYVYMAENTSDNVNYLKINGSALVYRGAGSDNFYGFKIKDGEVFYLKHETSEALPVIKLNTLIPEQGTEYVELKPDEPMVSCYDPVLSSLDGVGVWFELGSQQSPVTLTADKGSFKVFTYTSGGLGTVDNVGKTYELDKSGSVSWVPEILSIPDGYEEKIHITDSKNADLGTLVITKNPKSGEGVFCVTLKKPKSSASSDSLPALSDILTIKTEYDPVMSDWSGIGILLEFDSPEYDITLDAADGQFVEWDTVKGSGPVKNAGKTYEIGKSGSIFWDPDDMCYTDGLVSEITVKGTNGNKQVELGKIYITHNDRLVFTASLEKPESKA